MNPNHKPWTPEEDRRLRDLARQGLSSYDIAARLDRHRNGVVWRASRFGLKFMRADSWRPEEDRELRELADKGRTSRQIAGEMGRSANSIRNRAKRLGVSLMPYPPQQGDDADHPSKAGPRTCLGCGNTFRSAGPHNRMCSGCRQSQSAAPGWEYVTAGGAL